MAPAGTVEIDLTTAPFDRFSSVQRLGADRRGPGSSEYARHQLYVGRDRETRTNRLVKLATRPGKVYQQDLENEIASLTTVNAALPESRYFPVVYDHGSRPDGRVYLVSTFFDERPLATAMDTEWVPDRLVAHLSTMLEVATAVGELHGVPVFHVDLNPMNILHRVERRRPIVRIVDFESSYDAARHGAGVFYSPPTTTGFSAPEVAGQPPDARADVFSLGAVLHTMLAGYAWEASGAPHARIAADDHLDPDLRDLLLTAVAPDPADRHPSAGAFRAALAGYLESIWPGRLA